MREGLKIIKLPGYYGLTRVGWLKRIAGDEYVLLPGARTIWRTSGNRFLEHLADDGPKNDHEMAVASKGPDEINRLLVMRCLPANEKAWKEHVPRPKDWKDAE